MAASLAELFNSSDFMPHGLCLMWNPLLVWLHSTSDAMIGVAYFSIPFSILYFLRKRRDMAFPFVFLLFAIFILSCGTTHFMSIWLLWHPDYGVAGLIKAVTALSSVATAMVLWRVMPAALALPSPAQMRAANLALETEIRERREAEQTIRRSTRRWRSGFASAPWRWSGQASSWRSVPRSSTP